MTSQKRADVLAAGGIVWREGASGLEVLLVYRPSYRDWSLPKGKIKSGEDYRAAAVREIAEETGVSVALRQPAGSVSYVLPDGRRKEVRYWVAVPLPVNHPALRCRAAVKPAPAREIGASRWFQLKQALALLSMPSDRELLQRAMIDGAAAADIASRPVLLVRHGQACKRAAWSEGEETRPLTMRGKKQSRALASQLSWYGVNGLVSSSWERCMATLRPYAKSARLPIQEHPELTEKGYAEDEASFLATVTGLLHARAANIALLDLAPLDASAAPYHRGGTAPAAPDHRDTTAAACINEHGPDVDDGAARTWPQAETPTVAICLHRPTLPGVMETVSAMSPPSIRSQLPAEDPYLKPGEILVVHTSLPVSQRDVCVLAVEQFRPLEGDETARA